MLSDANIFKEKYSAIVLLLERIILTVCQCDFCHVFKDQSFDRLVYLVKYLGNSNWIHMVLNAYLESIKISCRISINWIKLEIISVSVLLFAILF